MSSQVIKTFSLTCALGVIRGAQGPGGLALLSLPAKGEEGFALGLRRRLPGADLKAVPAPDTEAGSQLIRYLAGELSEFSAPLDLRGLSPFSLAVLEQVRRIPYGQTRSYGQIAALAGRPGAARAVGRAMGANPLPLFIPCHRVLGAGGDLTGFGSGLKAKQALLDLEAGRLTLL